MISSVATFLSIAAGLTFLIRNSGEVTATTFSPKATNCMFPLQSSMPSKASTICAGARVLSNWKSSKYLCNQDSSTLVARWRALAFSLSSILPIVYGSRSDIALKYFSWGLCLANSGDKPFCPVRMIFWKLSARSATGSWSVSFPTAGKEGVEEVFPPVPICDVSPRTVILDEAGAFPRSSCTGCGCEAFPPIPKTVGFMPLINRGVSIQVL